MKFAIFGDIHANLEAFNTVLADAEQHGVTHYACIGDIVGYNANPHECLAKVRELACPVVKGNHDEEASAETEIIGLNPLAQAALEWTREHLNEEDKKWLKEQFVKFIDSDDAEDNLLFWYYGISMFSSRLITARNYADGITIDMFRDSKFILDTNILMILDLEESLVFIL